jgi:beta-lactamase class A
LAAGTPPRVSARVTTAQDLGRVLWSLHAAAIGDAAVLRRLGLTAHQARVGLALLLDCEAARDNIGLFREALPAGTPLAHKNGWIRAVRHDAAIVYAASGPRIVVLLTYREAGLDRRTAARFGASVLAATAPRG